jgi:hypothetical protein
MTIFPVEPSKERFLLAGAVVAAVLSVLIVSPGSVYSGQDTNDLAYAGKPKAYSDLLTTWNEDVFWAPASGFTGSNHWVNLFGDEARSVFGPIPEIDCGNQAGVPFRAEHEGEKVTDDNLNEIVASYDPLSPTKLGSTEASNDPETVCDKPSLANTGGRHACGTNSRISHFNNIGNSNVDWVVLCRKGTYGGIFYDIDYWSDESRDFALLGIIGFNASTGEVVFFDGTNKRHNRELPLIFSWKHKYPPPGGFGYRDPDRWVASEVYDYTSQLRCEGCHDNKEPWIMTPHLKYRGFGYRDVELENRFALEIKLPLVQPRSDKSPYRVIGTRYTRYADLTSKTFRDPTGSCTYCHTLTTDWTGKVLAYDAVGRKNMNEPYKSFFEKVHEARTDWAKRRHNTHPWMVPWLGPNVKPNPETGWTPTEIDEKNWDRIAACINEISTEDCQYKNVYTSCPAPESLKVDCSKDDELNDTCSRLADPFGPSEMTVITTPIDEVIEETRPYNRKTSVNWTYLNGLGGVPQRDDVRFNLAIKEVGLPIEAAVPKIEDYPSRQAATDPYFANADKKGDIHYCDLGARRQKTCHTINPVQGEFVINNISYAGHIRNTTPEPAYEPRQYSVAIPTQCNKRYLARLVPKRFCFDRSGVLASKVDHVKYFDVRCETE